MSNIPTVTDEYGKIWNMFIPIDPKYIKIWSQFIKRDSVKNLQIDAFDKHFIPPEYIITNVRIYDNNVINITTVLDPSKFSITSLESKYIVKPADLQQIDKSKLYFVPTFNPNPYIKTINKIDVIFEDNTYSVEPTNLFRMSSPGDSKFYYLNDTVVTYSLAPPTPPLITPSPTTTPSDITSAPTLPPSKDIGKYDKYNINANQKNCAEYYLKVNTAPLGSDKNPVCVRQYKDYYIDINNGKYILKSPSSLAVEQSTLNKSDSNKLSKFSKKLTDYDVLTNNINNLKKYDDRLFIMVSFLIIIGLVISILSLFINN